MYWIRMGKTRVPLVRHRFLRQTGVRRRMKFRQRGIWIAVFCMILAKAAQAQESASTSVSTAIEVSREALAAQLVGANWLSYNRDYTGRRVSSLDQIQPKNVGDLRAQWVFHSPNSNSLEVTPVVFDGLMFVTSANDAYALDGRTGRAIWHYSRPVTEGLIDDAAQHHNRGVGT